LVDFFDMLPDLIVKDGFHLLPVIAGIGVPLFLHLSKN
jgi:hypothetical protein